jgi:hypothetical protein
MYLNYSALWHIDMLFICVYPRSSADKRMIEVFAIREIEL